jgi:hypothetical protein
VNFNINEQEVLNIRADMRRLGISGEELNRPGNGHARGARHPAES